MPRSRSRKRAKRKRRSRSGSPGTRGRDEWIGGRLATPFFVEDREEPYRPEFVVWLDSHGSIVGYELLAPEEADGALAQLLVEAMERPFSGPRRRPDAIRVPNEFLAVEVGATVGSRIPIRVAPTPELDEVLESMIESFSEQGVMKPRTESYLAQGRIPPEAVAELFAAAKPFHEAAPWKVVTDTQVLRLDIPDLEVEGACISIVGNLGESFGFLVFPSFMDYVAFVMLADPSVQAPDGRPDFGTPGLALSFLRGADLPVPMRREVAAHGWPVASADAFPLVTRFDHDGMPFPDRPHDVRVAAAAAEAFPRFLAAHRNLFESEDLGPASETYRVLDGVEVRITAPAGPLPGEWDGTADAGPGSEPVVEGRGHSLHTLDYALVGELRSFAIAEFGPEWARYTQDFDDVSESSQLAAPWSVYHHRVGRETALEAFLRSPPRRLTEDEREWFEAQRTAWLSVWEVESVDPGESLTLRDLLSGEERCVHETSASATLMWRDAVLGRVVDHPEVSLLGGVHQRPLPPLQAAEVVRRARSRLRRRRNVPVGRLRDDSFGRHLIQYWEDEVRSLDAKALVTPELQNTDGDPLLLTTDHFHFESAAKPAVEAGLAAVEGAEPPEVGDDDPVYVFFPPGAEPPDAPQRTYIGVARLGDNSLRVQTNSRERADALRARIQAACGDGIRHRAREHADPTSEAAPFPSPESASAPPVPDEVFQEIKRQHYADWPDHPLPALDGMAAREAVRTADGRAAVDNLLKEMENHEQRAPGAPFDFSELRRELGLE